jgi:asparagine synthase (glutamine-hydrolysing)
MCGIVALFKALDTPVPASVLDVMRDVVAHRGPDGQGTVFLTPEGKACAGIEPSNTDWQVGLGHRRLSILDLSPAASQPMVYRDNVWAVYNGEIYNFVELRQELKSRGHVFRTASDTEVILAAYVEWGVQSFERLRGMWGLVLIDGVRKQAILCRDRLGIKPLYFWQSPGMVAVASEIKQFLHLPGFTARLDIAVATEYLQTGYEDPCRSFFHGIQPLAAGTWLGIPLDSRVAGTSESYWHPERVQIAIADSQVAGQLFASKIEESVRLHLRSDVPVGCSLSGGLDSSAIAVLVEKQRADGSEPLNTFTATFPGEQIDERDYADAVSNQICAVPHHVCPEAEQFVQDLDRFLWVQDEPVGSLSTYSSFCVARLTRHAGVPVSLSGQGGDEIFSGYWQSYLLYLRELGKQGNVAELASHFLGALGGKGNPDLIGQVPVMLRRYRARRARPEYLRVRGQGNGNGSRILQNIMGLRGQARRLYEVRQMFLPRLLRWDDRNSMAFSVEGRYPFLDHELIELCLSFAPHTLYARGWTKWPLRLGLKPWLPLRVANRRTKFGFETPQLKWLRGPLRPLLERWVYSDRPVWDFVEQKDMQEICQRFWQQSGSEEELGQTLFRIFFFDRWLDYFGISI